MKSLIFILTFLIAGMFFATAITADPQIQVSSVVNPTPVAPGTDGYVQLTFSNTGTSAVNNIQITGSSTDPSIRLSATSVVNLGSLGNGQSTTSLFKFSVLSSASSGLYTISFNVNYCSSTCVSVNPTAVITVQSPSALQVSSIQPDTVAAGQTATMNFNLVNQGNDPINNIVMTWQLPSNENTPAGHERQAVH